MKRRRGGAMKSQTKKTKVTEAIRVAGDHLQRKRLRLIADDPSFAASIVQEIEAEVGGGLDEASRTQRALALVQARELKEKRDARRRSNAARDRDDLMGGQSDEEMRESAIGIGNWFLQSSLSELDSVYAALEVAETGWTEDVIFLNLFKGFVLASLKAGGELPLWAEIREQFDRLIRCSASDYTLKKMAKERGGVIQWSQKEKTTEHKQKISEGMKRLHAKRRRERAKIGNHKRGLVHKIPTKK
jgi:hypothetical protein